MGEELKVNQDSTASNPEELSRQDQWDDIGKSSETSDNSDLEAAIDEVKTSEAEPEPGIAEEITTTTSEQDSKPEPIPIIPEVESVGNDTDANSESISTPEYISVEESKRKEAFEKLELDKKFLENRRKELAKAYAKNRGLLGSKKNSDYMEALNRYKAKLNECLKTEAEITYLYREKDLKQNLQTKLDELNKSDDDIEAKEQALNEAYAKECQEVRDAVNQKFLEGFLEQQNKLSEETIKEINGGDGDGLNFRKVVHAFRSNKYIKGAIIAAGVAGLAVATAGLAGVAAGTVSVGFGLTAKGALIGVARGAAGGFLGSRQDAKNSAIHGFQDNKKVRQMLEDLGDVTEKDTDTKGVAEWLMAEYDKANITDREDNRKRTLIATGLGAALGALSSGVQISKTTLTVENGQIGETPEIIDVTSNLDQVNIAEGHGAYDTFTQMGGNPEKIQEALDIMHSIDSKYGLVPGDSGAAGSFAHTYPGPISSWPDAAQVYIEEVAKEWAKRGLIEPTVIESGPIYGPVFKASQSYIYDGFLHYLADFATGAAAGTVVGDVKTSESSQTVKSEESERNPNNHEVTAAEIEKKINEKEAAEIEQQMNEKVTAEIEKQMDEKEAAEIKKEAAEIEKKINEKEAAEIEKQMDERVAAEIEQQINKGRTINQEFESGVRDQLAQNGIDYLGDNDINPILTPNTTPVRIEDIERLADRLTWESKKALKDFFIQQKNRNLMTTQFGEWIIANTPDENPRITAEREQSWQV